jgi:hypothetical protein
LRREAESSVNRHDLLQSALSSQVDETEEPEQHEEEEQSQSDRDSIISSPVSASSIKSFFTRAFVKSNEATSPTPIPWKEPQARPLV